MSEHQFDAFTRKAASALDRRGSLRALATAAVALGFILGETPRSVLVKGKKGKGKGPGKGNGKPKPKPKPKPKKPCPREPQTCSGGACGAEPKWAGKQCQINHCEFICRQCDGDDPREFCIRKGAKRDGTPTKVADCCRKDEKCCDSDCVDPENDPRHCGTCFNECRALQICHGGGCRCPPNTQFCPTDRDGCCTAGETCGANGCEQTCPLSCPAGETCCPSGDGFGTYECADLTSSRKHCGSCGNSCNQFNGGHECDTGSCSPCSSGEKLCLVGPDSDYLSCIPEHWECCENGFVCPSGECCISSPINGGHHYCSHTGDCPY